MKTKTHLSPSYRFQYLFLALLLVSFSLDAAILDDFNDNTKTGWTDTLNAGTVTEANGQFAITTAAANGSLTSSKKTTTSYTIVAGSTLEFRADVEDVVPGTGDTNALAILGWVPTGGAILANGYNFVVGANDVQIVKNGATLYSTEVALQNTNITAVLRLTPLGGGVSVNVRVYRQIAAGSFIAGTVLFEYTYQDAAATLVGVAGNAALGVKNQASATGCSVTFDDLQVFDLTNSVLDNFDVADNLSGWTTFKKDEPNTTTESGGQATSTAIITSAAGGFAGAYYSAKTFKIIDGSQISFSIDVVQNIGAVGCYTVLGYLPSAAGLFSLQEYFIAHNEINTTVLLTGKRLGVYSGASNASFPINNVRYTLTMTGEGANCRIESRLEDLSVTDVNDPLRVVFQDVYIDTPAGELANEAATGLSAPYMNLDGNFVFSVFNAGIVAPPYATAIFDNATISQTLPPNAAPIIANVNLAQGANFVAATNVVEFDVSDEINVPTDRVVVTLNGVNYTNGHPNLIMTPNTSPAASRHVVLTNVLGTNVNYSGTIQATDPLDAIASVPLLFDTFVAADVYVVESEEYNFSTDGLVTGGGFINNPILVGEGLTDVNAYNSQTGAPEIDFHDNRGAHSGIDNEHIFRTEDNVYTFRTTDVRRQKYITAGPASGSGGTYTGDPGDGGFNEVSVGDIRDSDWMNYSHAYPAGTYNIYLRQATYAILNSLVTLDRVTNDPTTNGQTTTTVGNFFASVSGLGQFRNVPLTDGIGNLSVVRFTGGVDTLRISQRVTGNADQSDGILEQNYFVLVPVADPGILRPFVSSASPAPNAVISGSSPPTAAFIANGDTTVSVGTVALTINGSPVAATVTPVTGGVNVTWSLSVLPPARFLTNTLTYADSAGTNLTFSWSYSYPFLSAANRLPSNALTQRGFDYRMVYTAGATLGNSLNRAEGQLATPPEYTIDQTFSTNQQTLYWNNDNGVPINVPGLDTTGLDNIATESLGYIQLTAGAHRFHAISDDGFQLRSGAYPKDPLAVTLGIKDDGTFNGTFDFMVEADGLYPIRNLWYENGGGASFQLNSVNPDTSAEVVVNDPADPAGVVKVFNPNYPVVLESTTNPASGWTVEAGAVVDRDARTVTLPRSGDRRFYKINLPSANRIVKAVVSGSNIVLTYQFQ